MIRLLGPPSPSFLARGNLTPKFFSEEGKSSIYHFPIYRKGQSLTISAILGTLCPSELVGEHIPLEQRETSLEGEEKEMFLRLVRKMLQWEPEKRSSSGELEQDEWVQAELRK
jgi:hypothetical protein